MGSMINEELLELLVRREQNKCITLLHKTMPVNEIYKKYTILQLDELINLELKKLSYKANANQLPSNFLSAIRTGSDGNLKPIVTTPEINTN